MVVARLKSLWGIEEVCIPYKESGGVSRNRTQAGMHMGVVLRRRPNKRKSDRVLHQSWSTEREEASVSTQAEFGCSLLGGFVTCFVCEFDIRAKLPSPKPESPIYA
jgi:hypothetical protein